MNTVHYQNLCIKITVTVHVLDYLGFLLRPLFNKFKLVFWLHGFVFLTKSIWFWWVYLYICYILHCIFTLIQLKFYAIYFFLLLLKWKQKNATLSKHVQSPTENRRMRQISIPLTHKIHEHSLSLLDTDTAINSGGFKLAILVQT